MRRVRLRTGRTALFVAMLAAALVVFLPMRLMLGWVGLGDRGMTARKVDGTIWSGSLTETRFGDVALGDLSAGVSPVRLLVGRARIHLAGRDNQPAPSVNGAITVSRHSLGIDDTTAAIPLGRAFAPLPISAIDLTDVSVRFTDGACDRAEGRVRATLSGSIANVPVAQAMSGSVRCEAGALLLPLAGQAGGEIANLRVWQDGRYRAELVLNPGDPAAGVGLQSAGFVQTQQGWRFSVEGVF